MAAWVTVVGRKAWHMGVAVLKASNRVCRYSWACGGSKCGTGSGGANNTGKDTRGSHTEGG